MPHALLRASIALWLLAAAPAQANFAGFVEGLWPLAREQGISRATFDRAFRGVTPDQTVVALTKRQSEFVRPIWGYLDDAVSATRVSRGRAAAQEWEQALAAAERQYGVDRRVIMGIWGMETNYGSFTGTMDVVRSLATLAYVRYRGTFFRDELLQALLILQQEHVDRADMKGSWAGAMGQTQFMPSSFMKYAVDHDGDGSRDIWSSKRDAIGSTANYLKAFGWQTGLPWGFEVELPEGFDYKLADRAVMRSFAEWRRLGLSRADGRTFPANGEAAIFLPAGAKGPKLLVTANFDVIKKYNSSDAYALGVAGLGDRIFGSAGLVAPWPRNEKPLSMAEAKDLQRLLQQKGFAIEKVDGKIGTGSRAAVRAYQLQAGLLPDGHPTRAILQRLRGGRAGS